MYPRYTKDEKEFFRRAREGITKAKYSMSHQNPNDACRLTNIKACKRIIFDLEYERWKIKGLHKEKVKKWRREKIVRFYSWFETLSKNIYTVFYNFYITILMQIYRNR